MKDEVRIVKVSDGFSKTKDYNDYVKELQHETLDDPPKEDDNHTVLIISDFPVKLNSICGGSGSTEQSSNFLRRVQLFLAKDEKR